MGWSKAEMAHYDIYNHLWQDLAKDFEEIKIKINFTDIGSDYFPSEITIETKSFVFYTLGLASWFIAEQIWIAYDYFLEGDPFPSEADFFYIIAYPFMAAFLFYSLKPILKSVSRNVWLFANSKTFSI
ncbi:hypothetical protein IIA28_20200 [candidate division KSB1 bacterium]|nr:hypothetical protein [candidate division KSB1 bacterium]